MSAASDDVADFFASFFAARAASAVAADVLCFAASETRAAAVAYLAATSCPLWSGERDAVLDVGLRPAGYKAHEGERICVRPHV